MKTEQTECSETSAYKIQTPGNYPEENIQHTEQSKSLKSRIVTLVYSQTWMKEKPASSANFCHIRKQCRVTCKIVNCLNVKQKAAPIRL